MKRLFFPALLGLLAACAEAPPPALSPSPDPSEPAAGAASDSYRSVTAGTVFYKPIEPLPWEQVNQRVAPRAGGR
jgi:hypothetical protein